MLLFHCFTFAICFFSFHCVHVNKVKVPTSYIHLVQFAFEMFD
jgi:hypothetical protein